MTHYVQERVERLERPITAWFLISVIFALVCVYAYFVNGAIANAVYAGEVRSEMAALSSKVSGMESAYIAAKSSLDIAYAFQAGFAESKDGTIYIAKKPVEALSFNR